MSTETEDLELLRGLLEKATPGPWSIYKHFNAPEGLHTWEIKGETRDDDIADGMLKEDAVLIAALRNALPSLLSRTQALESALAQSTSALDLMRYQGVDLESLIATNDMLLKDFSWEGREVIASPLALERERSDRIAEVRDAAIRRTQAAEKALEEAREIARCAKASATEAERLLGEYQLRALKAESALDEAGKALAKWPCPGCGGKKVYVWQQTAVPCKVCEETGIHPIARSALGTPS